MGHTIDRCITTVTERPYFLTLLEFAQVAANDTRVLAPIHLNT